jgi:predicted RNase H-like nuclease (RuvC/YqgF family)
MPDQTAKKQVAVRIPLREKAELEREASDQGISRSEYIRSILRNRHRADKLEKRLETRNDRVEELETQLGRRSQIEDKIENLPDKIRDELSYTERRQRKLDQASLGQRLKWKFTGVPVDTEDDETEQ